ncbi:MAG: hypothetical protein JW915_00775 [Chitinispirillaceae bacterium]|nr:hypothetical protein [Chitinispirillaceae bacterium]
MFLHKIFLRTIVLLLVVFIHSSFAKWVDFNNTTSAIGKKTEIKCTGIDVHGNESAKLELKKVDKMKVSIKLNGVHLNKVKAKDGLKYSDMVLPDADRYRKLGAPAVPMKVIMVEIPANAEAEVSLLKKAEKKMDDITLVPVQPIPEDNADDSNIPFEKDNFLYQSASLYPEKQIVNTSTFFARDRKILVIHYCPVQVVSDEEYAVITTNADIIIKLNSTGEDNISAGLSSSSFTAMTATGAITLPSTYDNGTVGENPERYMILMNDQFYGNARLNEFIEWKKRKGYSINVVKTSDINSNGHPHVDTIINYMRALADSVYPTYLLIIGMKDSTDGVAAWKYSFNGTLRYTDLYTSCRDDADFVPDLFCGRLVAADTAELSSILEKVIEMDRNPPFTDMYDKTVVSAYFQSGRIFTETGDAVACYFEQDAGGVNYETWRAFVGSVDSTTPWPCTVDSINAQIHSILWHGATGNDALIGSRVSSKFLNNADACDTITNRTNEGIAILFHRDHGGTDGYGHPSWRTPDVLNLTNGVNRPLVLSIDCSTGEYWIANNFTHAWVTHVNGGAYGVVAAVGSSPSGPNDYLAHGIYMGFLDDYRSWHNNSTAPDFTSDFSVPDTTGGYLYNLVDGAATKLGQMLWFGKWYVMSRYGDGVYAGQNQSERISRLYHVFGDPEAEVVLHTPQVQTIHHSSDIPTGSQTVNVITGNEDAQVCLYSEALGIHQVAIGDTVSFNINPSTTGSIHVTVTGFSLRPYEGIINVGSSTINDVLGFENASQWRFAVGSGFLTNDTTIKTEGNASIQVGGYNYREITSIPMSTTEIAGETSTLAIDLFVGLIQPNPSWIGQIQLHVSCPSAGIYHQYLGSLELTDLPRGVFSTVTFFVPGNVLSVLQGDYDDFDISIDLNTNYGSGRYFLDNMRFVP